MTKEHKAITRGAVLITRPEQSAHVTAEKLTALGFSPVSLPVNRMIALPFNMLGTAIDALIMTSANALRYVPGEYLAMLKTIPVFAVGEGTTLAAQEAGFKTVIEGGGDAMRLAATIAKQLPNHARLLYLAGQVRQPVFEDKMSEAGFAMDICNVYNVEEIDYSANEIKAALDKGPFVAVLLYSAVAAQIFVEKMQKFNVQFDAETRFFCISERVARQLPKIWQRKALIADHPDESGIFRLFSKL
ncbi:uroporphyrinogen-III synthase [Brucella gallinifaecis]|uniref:Uroporphyrinogen-III synthase n=1 Tax=Brucella gallinifaecis TaxID=215590 RepID=A0A502BL76_9HYPH|nr:uroporphyrinogen-III synthase [Brucella gallinifaecis]TPF74804.1 uroporphyrinogen-III synthase [Brucella gallinifaecis]